MLTSVHSQLTFPTDARLYVPPRFICIATASTSPHALDTGSYNTLKGLYSLCRQENTSKHVVIFIASLYNQEKGSEHVKQEQITLQNTLD
ncbi:hypothetical protein E2C01_032221 [Portunus trituberculatus]|uniref:Uncharacterized protein n=1 Tax=Portunus trituberculatus TaxID=210409 RepID=A0A5B7F0D3_PORTR|nr:hypothetical protein [Portunus trituberculatus]